MTPSPEAAYELAQVNIGRLKAPLDSAELKPFADGLAPVNAVADASDGFVWRLQDDTGDATDLRAFDEWLSQHVGVAGHGRPHGVHVPGAAPGVAVAPQGVLRAAGGGGHDAVVGTGGTPSDRQGGGDPPPPSACHGPTEYAFTLRTSFPPGPADPLPAPLSRSVS